MKQNSKIQKWLDIGKRNFAERGVSGIHINAMSEEMGVAKTSFYYFFHSKEEFLKQLFAYWEVDGTDRLYSMVNQIEDPARRFSVLGKLISDNKENENFYFQLKLFSKENDFARAFLDRVDEKRNKIADSIFREAGQTENEIAYNRYKMMIYFYGNLAMQIGYASKTPSYEMHPDEILEFFGLKK